MVVEKWDTTRNKNIIIDYNSVRLRKKKNLKADCDSERSFFRKLRPPSILGTLYLILLCNFTNYVDL